jgi:biotin operon repressor
MDNQEHSRITPESVLASVKEMFAVSSERLDCELQKSREEFDRRMQELRDSQAEVTEQQKETGRLMKDVTEQQKETGRLMKDATEQQKETGRLMKVLGEQVGGWNNSHGLFAEEYFFNSFNRDKKNFFGEKFDNIKKNLKGIATDDEFDVVLLNGHSVAIIETKFRARSKDVNSAIKKVNAFKRNYPNYQNCQFYIGMASMVFEKQAETKCIEKGIAIIKQVGDTVVINDKHLKTF